jgi:16S rRNA A1518/A1519 N6-dimethyltransferase RsmA/KsgA/DIM1 with predicted DNA glycosylase/AP lyase activity
MISTKRYRWLPKSQVVEILRLQPGMNIAEIGAGAGDLILPISEAVGPAGHTFAIEIAPEPLVRLRERAQGSRNVHVIEAPYHATHWPSLLVKTDRLRTISVHPLRQRASIVYEPIGKNREVFRPVSCPAIGNGSASRRKPHWQIGPTS